MNVAEPVGVLGLGSNLGDAPGHLRAGLVVLRRRLELRGVSRVFQTTPVGGAPQPDYLNAVVIVTDTDPEELLAAAWEAETARGRVRETVNGPRTLDVDVLAAGSRISDDPRLVLPHPRAHRRAFVLAPWAELDPDAVLPGRGPVRALLAALPAADRAGVRPRDELELG